ncbi:MAG: hypothetical protein CVT92_14670 [Bacteroidetes bacterium HGW-Bacteroidetes-1]|jgi:myosin heavy subunit|nr:MAG: hypothetical protein CVT92_14670 [Bacteroidetes bacterium HGW-Bacteroidetes-1]
MKTKLNKEKIIAGSAVVLLLVILIGTFSLYNNGKSLKSNLNSEKLKTEMMLSERLALQKEINNFRTQINSLIGKNTELDKLLAQTTKKLNNKQAEMNKIVKDNSNIALLKTQIEDLNRMKKDFENEVLTMNETIQRLNNENDTKDQKMASLQKENEFLSANLAMLNSMMASDDYLVETSKKNQKLTAKAKQTKKMSLTFNVPDNIVSNINFKITKPDGKLVEGKDSGIAYNLVDENETLLASNTVSEINIVRKIEMNYTPKKKLKPGIYKIAIYNGDRHIGTCNVNLR